MRSAWRFCFSEYAVFSPLGIIQFSSPVLNVILGDKPPCSIAREMPEATNEPCFRFSAKRRSGMDNLWRRGLERGKKLQPMPPPPQGRDAMVFGLIQPLAVLARGVSVVSGVIGAPGPTVKRLLTSFTPGTDSAMSSARRFSRRLSTRPESVTVQLFTLTSMSLASTYQSSVRRSFM